MLVMTEINASRLVTWSHDQMHWQLFDDSAAPHPAVPLAVSTTNSTNMKPLLVRGLRWKVVFVCAENKYILIGDIGYRLVYWQKLRHHESGKWKIGACSSYTSIKKETYKSRRNTYPNAPICDKSSSSSPLTLFASLIETKKKHVN